MEGNDPFLPNDIISNILTRLPLKSLIRFQRVCKYWKNLLKDPFFIADHLHQSSQRPSLLLYQNYDRSGSLHLRSLDCEFRLHTSFINYFSSLQYARIVNSCNGLVCVDPIVCFKPPLKLLLWNPSTKEVREVHGSDGTNDFRITLSIGFGFSRIANDYKIVKIYGSGPYWSYTGGVNRVELYSLGTRLWRDVEFEALKGIHVKSKTATANGAIIWVGQKDRDRSSLMIVLFDIEVEMFKLIPMAPIHPSSTIIPTVYDNKLATLSYYEKGPFDLWVIEEKTCPSGERWTWTKIYSSSPYLYPHPYVLVPLIIWRNEVVCEAHLRSDFIGKTEGFLYLLNPTTDEVKKIVKTYFGDGDQALSYVESFVPIG